MDIKSAIPHREPFLFVDEVIKVDDKKIVAIKKLDPDMDVFKGHYPNFPIFPGVLTMESIFQAGAILISRHMKGGDGGAPVITRVRDAKFRFMVRPEDTLTLTVSIEEIISSKAFYMKGVATVDGKTAARVDFTCALAPLPEGLK